MSSLYYRKQNNMNYIFSRTLTVFSSYMTKIVHVKFYLGCLDADVNIDWSFGKNVKELEILPQNFAQDIKTNHHTLPVM